MHFFRFTKSAAALLLLTVGLAAPAYAQNNKPIRSGNFYEDRASGTIVSTGIVLHFAQAPTDTFFNATNVACSIATVSTQVMQDVFLYASTSGGPNDLGRPYSILGNAVQRILGTQAFYNISANQILYKMGPGRYPTIEIDAPAQGSYSVTANCVIVGNLTDN